MIFEPLINIIVELIVVAINGFNLVTLPVNALEALATIMVYGNAVVGADLMLVFASNVLAWMGLKLTVGILLFIWRLLPLT